MGLNSFSLGYFSASPPPEVAPWLLLVLLAELSFFSERGPLLELNSLSISAPQLLYLSGARGGSSSPFSCIESPAALTCCQPPGMIYCWGGPESILHLM